MTTELGLVSRWALSTWLGSLILIQALNLFLAVSWPYLLGVFGLLVNGFLFFVRLLLADPEERSGSA